MDQPKISVIVPVYKAEAYLQQCVDSIRNQTYRNLEIILVDDGSPDRCGAMCDAFACEDDRIRVIHKENGGQSSARNAALDVMSGAYVGFVDSDDWVEPDMYQRLYEHLIENDAQISACGIQIMHLDGSVGYFNKDYPASSECRLYDRIDALHETLMNERVTYSLCDKLFVSEIFQDLRMTDGKIFEDMELVPRCIECAQRIAYDPRPLYHYNLTQGSTIRGEFNPGRFAEADVALERAKDYLNRYPQLYHDAMARYIVICLNIIYLSKDVPSCAQRRRELIEVLRSNGEPEAVKRLRRNDRIKLAALRMGEPVFMVLMTVYNRFRSHP